LSRSLGLAFERSNYIGVVISPRFSTSEWCLDELSQAIAREKRSHQKGIVPLLYEHATPPPLIEDRIYINFDTNYWRAVTELSVFIHELRRRDFTELADETSISTLADAYEMLASIGWDRISLFDEEDVTEFHHTLIATGEKHALEKEGAVLFNFDTISHLADWRDLRVVKEFLRLTGAKSPQGEDVKIRAQKYQKRKKSLRILRQHRYKLGFLERTG
jgi:TIR domain